MSRTYAGILSLLAMLVIVARGIKEGADAAGTCWDAFVGLSIFFGIGIVIGRLAEGTVLESVRRQMEDELGNQGETNEASTA